MKKLFVAVLMGGSLLFSCQKKADPPKPATEAKKVESPEKKTLEKPYNPNEDAEKKIAELQQRAAKENKNIILQAGGNWCIWCLRFTEFVKKDPEIKEVLDTNFLYYHLNNSPEQKNEKIFARYGNPGDKFGYPVLLVIDSSGKLLKVQETGVLEDGNSYSKERVLEIFKQWIKKT